VKVLILHQHFHTPDKGGPLRSYYIAKALIAKGVWPVVITTHSEKKYKVEISEGMEVHYLPIAYENRYGFYKRTRAFLRYAAGAVNIARKFKQAKICYAISVPLTVGVAAIAIKKLFTIPFIFEVGDLWPEAPIQLGFIKDKRLKKFLYYLERRIYTEAMSLVALSRPISDNIKRRYPEVHVDVIPNMADTAFFKPGKSTSRFQLPADKFIISYLGAIGFANGLEQMLECCGHSMNGQLPVHFVICGDGAMAEELKNSKTVMGLDNLTFLPFQNRDGVREIMNITDAVFVSYRDVPVLQTGSPHKYFDGLAAGKLVITNFGGWIKSEIEIEQCGFSVDPQKPSEFPKLIAPFLNDGKLLSDWQHNARLLAETRYSRAKLSSELSEVIIDLKR
jgi:glycosyltransferase involved in cell wall biosynthesis